MDWPKEDSWHVVTEANAKDFGQDVVRTSAHWLEVAHVAFDNRNDDGTLDASTSVDMIAGCKWDGCVHLHVGIPASDANGGRDYVHICDVDDFIAKLQRIRDMARAHFGKNWPR